MKAAAALIALSALAGCGLKPSEVVSRHIPAEFGTSKAVLLDEKTLMPEQTPLSIGFWGGTADVRLEAGPEEDEMSGRISSVVVQDVDSILDRSSDNEQLESSGMNPPKKRGFMRFIPRILYGVETGQADGAHYKGARWSTGTVYWLQPRQPNVPEGWKLKEQKLRIEALPLSYEYKGIWGGGTRTKINKDEVKWDISSIDLDPEWAFAVTFNQAFDNPLSQRPSKRPSQEEMYYYSMEPLVFVEVLSYTLQQDSTGQTKQGELLTGWIEAAGKFVQNGPR
jgi:hypothetical protein